MKNDFTENFAIRRIVEISIVNTAITASNIALFLFELENINLRVHEIVLPEKQKKWKFATREVLEPLSTLMLDIWW